jgi:hypothetical protein
MGVLLAETDNRLRLVHLPAGLFLLFRGCQRHAGHEDHEAQDYILKRHLDRPFIH